MRGALKDGKAHKGAHGHVLDLEAEEIQHFAYKLRAREPKTTVKESSEEDEESGALSKVVSPFGKKALRGAQVLMSRGVNLLLAHSYWSLGVHVGDLTEGCTR